jgi:membrane-associated phospholipid phosphatase
MLRWQLSGAAALAALLLGPAAAAGQPPAVARDTVVGGSDAAVDPARRQSDRPRRDMPSFTGLFTGLSGDLARLGSSDHVLFTTFGMFGAMGAHSFDHRIAQSGWGRGTARDIFGPGEIAGGAVVQSTTALGTYLIGRAFGKPRVARIGGELIRAQLVGQSVTQAIKLSVGRTRPDGSTLSFPSGHTSATFATATVLQREFGWKAGLPAYAVASWVAASRMHAERHYLSDVVMGATIGILAGRAVTVGTDNTRFAISPAAVPRGAGINIVRVK